MLLLMTSLTISLLDNITLSYPDIIVVLSINCIQVDNYVIVKIFELLTYYLLLLIISLFELNPTLGLLVIVEYESIKLRHESL